MTIYTKLESLLPEHLQTKEGLTPEKLNFWLKLADEQLQKGLYALLCSVVNTEAHVQ
jgi:hypothetical protein